MKRKFFFNPIFVSNMKANLLFDFKALKDSPIWYDFWRPFAKDFQ